MRTFLSDVGFGLLCALLFVLPAYGETEGDLAKQSQNPVGNLISLPFQNNTGYNFGPRDRTQNVLNIQPVIPLSINEDWNLITRTIFPIVSQPSFRVG